MTMIQKMLYAGAASVALFAVAPASAATTLNSTSTSFDGKTGFYGATINGVGEFVAPFVFNVGPLPGKAAISITSVSLNSAEAIDNLTVTLNNVSYPITSSVSLPNGFLYSFGGFSQAVNAGFQNLSVSGTTTALSSSFSGTIAFTAAVPEPASWALMIGGFGLVGGVMRRRAKVANVNYSFA